MRVYKPEVGIMLQTTSVASLAQSILAQVIHLSRALYCVVEGDPSGLAGLPDYRIRTKN